MKTRYLSLGFELTAELEKYADGKTARLTRKIPHRFRAAANCSVTFSQAMRNGNKSSTCSIVLALSNEKLTAKETTQHMYAALDIAAVDIEQQLKSYTRTHRRGILRRRRTPEG